MRAAEEDRTDPTAAAVVAVGAEAAVAIMHEVAATAVAEEEEPMPPEPQEPFAEIPAEEVEVLAEEVEPLPVEVLDILLPEEEDDGGLLPDKLVQNSLEECLSDLMEAPLAEYP